MSYILDALQKSAAAENPVTVHGGPPQSSPGLALPWKLAIGAVLIANLVLLYLWRTDREAVPVVVQQADTGQQASAPQTAANQYQTTPGTQPVQPRKTLPGIASPRPAAPPRTASTAATSNPRTFRPSGTPITMAESTGGAGTAPPAAQGASRQVPVTQAAGNQRTQTNNPSTGTRPGTPSRRENRGVSQLSQLSNGAREALYVLSFSTHIYGSDRDLRAVVVNGQRLTEGNSVTADNGQEFLLLEIIDNGVIMQFEHEGSTESVQIPVMEDWKDA